MSGLQRTLGNIMERLDALEIRPNPDLPTTPARATTSPHCPPSPPAHDIADRVTQHMREYGLLESEEEFTHSGKAPATRLKSGRTRTTADTVMRQVPWPHFGIFKGPARKPATYDSLTMAEFVAGYARLVIRADAQTQKPMLAHLAELMEDATSFPFPNVRNYHGIVLSLMEQDDLTWSDTESIQKLRQQYARVANPAPAPSTPTGSSGCGGKPCPDYQIGKCTLHGTHEHRGEKVDHVCAFCMAVKRRAFPHSERDCLTKAHREASKNE